MFGKFIDSCCSCDCHHREHDETYLERVCPSTSSGHKGITGIAGTPPGMFLGHFPRYVKASTGKKKPVDSA